MIDEPEPATMGIQPICFRLMWRVMSRYEEMPAVDSPEYDQVFAAWQQAGSPSPVAPFIRARVR